MQKTPSATPFTIAKNVLPFKASSGTAFLVLPRYSHVKAARGQEEEGKVLWIGWHCDVPPDQRGWGAHCEGLPDYGKQVKRCQLFVAQNYC